MAAIAKPLAKKAAPATERKKTPLSRKPKQAHETQLTPKYLQAKLAVSKPADSAEQEADKVATQVARSPRVDEPRQISDPKVHNASLEPGITPQKDETLAPKPVPAAEQIQRLPEQQQQRQLAEEEEETLQTKQSDSDRPAPLVDDETEQHIELLRGNGSPLAQSILEDMNNQFGYDFGNVRIHDDTDAAELCTRTHARAFTVGSDLFFAQGEYAPETDKGRELLAHELTHVVQQSAGLKRMLMRNNTTGTSGGSGASSASTGPLSISSLPIPSFKYASGRYQSANLLKAKEYNRSGENQTYQSHTWDREVNKRGVVTKLRETVGMNQADHTYIVMSNPRNLGRNPVGDADTIAGGLLRPWWARDGRGIRHEVDHILELQLSGWPRIRTADRMSNYELVDRTSNGASGREIDQALTNAVRSAVPGSSPRTTMRSRDVQVTSVSNSGTLANASRWSKQEIEQGMHIDTAVANQGGSSAVVFWDLDNPTAHGHFSAPSANLNTENYKGSSNKLVVYYGSSGSYRRSIDFASQPQSQTSPEITNSRALFIRGFQVERIVFNRTRSSRSEPVGVVHGRVFQQQQSGGRIFSSLGSIAWNIRSLPTTDYAGFLDSGDLRNLIRFNLNFMSPIRFDSIDLDAEEGLIARGKVLPSIPLFRGADIDLVASGDDLRLEKFFSVDEVHLPPPLQMDSCSLGVSLGTRSGLRFSGETEFSIRQLGQGRFHGSVGSNGSETTTSLEGEFNFDSTLFDRANVQAWYRNDQFGVSGEIGIDDPNKIRGIRAANLRIAYEEGQLNATGSVDPDIPGVEQAGLSLQYSETAGMTIGGNLQLSANPAIRSGSLEVTLRKLGEDWRVSGTGTAQPAIPGINSELTVSYDNGAFGAEFSGQFQRGMLSGQVTVGATNRTLDESGQPTGEPAADSPIIVYGSGSSTIRIAPWLEGTAGITFAPNGEVTMRGEIGLPDQLEIFRRLEINRRLLDLSTQIPIVPGVVAEVGGNLTATAGIGPGALDQLRIGIEYNPAQEQNTHVTGDAHLNIPADAGLRLGARAGIGLGITGASATGGLEIGGTMGIQGAAEAGVHIDWMPSRGLQIDAEGYLHAEPRFRFDVGGYVSVRALGFSVYDNRWELAAYELGSNMRLGVRFPIRYREGQPFNISLDDVQFEVPEVNPSAMIRELGNRIF